MQVPNHLIVVFGGLTNFDFEGCTLIKGELITIRNVLEADLDELYRLSFDHTDSGEFMPVGFTSETAFKSEFQQTGFWDEYTGKLVIVDVDGRLIGMIGLMKSSHYIDGRELYYRLFSGHRGKGYASEAIKLFIKFYFEASSFNRLQAVTINGNEISEHILKKFGFMFEGTLRKARYFKGNLVDLNLFSLLRSDLT